MLLSVFPSPAKVVKSTLLVVLFVAGFMGWGVVGPRAQTPAAKTVLGAPGYLIIAGVRDSVSVFAWQAGPGPGRHSLVWPEGTLSLPVAMDLEDFGAVDGGVACRPELSGVGDSGQLVFEDGKYVVSEPVALSDGVLELHLAAGELTVRDSQITYRRPDPRERQTQANYIFLGGIIVLIVVLMRRARQQLRKT